MGERLVLRRTTLGLTQKESAESIGVDPSTLAKWERGEREPAGTFLVNVERFLDGEQGQRRQDEPGSPKVSTLAFRGYTSFL